MKDVDVTTVPTDTLERLLGLLQSGRLAAPLTDFEISARGLGALSHTGLFELQDSSNVAAVLRAVMNERRAHTVNTPELVWTGPETKVSGARDTAVVLQELFSSAKRSVLMAGYRFDHGETVLAPLHNAMALSGLHCSIFANRDDGETFIKHEWPFGPPFPDIFVDSRDNKFSSVHAKCVVVDGLSVLVTSANFTDRGQTRNVEVGVRLVDGALALRLTQQLLALVSTGIFAKLET